MLSEPSNVASRVFNGHVFESEMFGAQDLDAEEVSRVLYHALKCLPTCTGSSVFSSSISVAMVETIAGDCTGDWKLFALMRKIVGCGQVVGSWEVYCCTNVLLSENGVPLHFTFTNRYKVFSVTFTSPKW